MPGQAIGTSNKPFLSVVAGNFVQKVDKDTPGARTREYELRDSTKAVKHELVWMNWSGVIQAITFKETEYGTVCNVHLEDAILSLNTSSRYFSDFACKILGADLRQELTFHPFDMEIEDGKRRQGISVQQNGVKLKNFFWDGENLIGGFPAVNPQEQARMKKNYWKIYFAEVEAFLTEKLQALPIAQKEILNPVRTEPVDASEIPDLEETTEVTLETGEKIKVPTTTVNPDPLSDLPF